MVLTAAVLSSLFALAMSIPDAAAPTSSPEKAPKATACVLDESLIRLISEIAILLLTLPVINTTESDLTVNCLIGISFSDVVITVVRYRWLIFLKPATGINSCELRSRVAVHDTVTHITKAYQ